jgi:hypothetical protein
VRPRHAENTISTNKEKQIKQAIYIVGKFPDKLSIF